MMLFNQKRRSIPRVSHQPTDVRHSSLQGVRLAGSDRCLPIVYLATMLLLGPIALSFATDGLAAEQRILLVPAAPAPVSLTLDLPADRSLKPGDVVELVEVDASGTPLAEKPATLLADILPGIAADGTPSEPHRLAAIIPTRKGAASPRRFMPRMVEAKPSAAFALEEIDGRSLLVKDVALSDAAGGEDNADNARQADGPSADQLVFQYNFGVITAEHVPEREHRRRRGCYIHPVWGMHGEVLTDDFPRDHYHHHGVFWTWPHVDFPEDDKKAYDSWQKDQLWQEYHAWLARRTGRVSAVVGVENHWMADRDQPRHVMTERMWMQPYQEAAGSRAIDLRLVLDPEKGPVTLWGAGGKSYGGMTMRFIGIPHKDQVVTTPDGPSKKDRKMTPLRWVDFARHFAGAPHRSGATLMIHPAHPDYPPTWLTRTYGPQCVGWPGVEPQTLQPGSPVTLPYRIYIHDEEMSTEQLEAAYAAFVAGTKARWE